METDIIILCFSISYFHPFGTKCYILNNGKDQLAKFDARSDEGIFLRYALTSKAYRIFNKRTLVVEESIHIGTFDNLPLASVDDMCENIDKIYLDNKIDNAFFMILSPLLQYVCLYRSAFMCRLNDRQLNML